MTAYVTYIYISFICVVKGVHKGIKELNFNHNNDIYWYLDIDSAYIGQFEGKMLI